MRRYRETYAKEKHTFLKSGHIGILPSFLFSHKSIRKGKNFFILSKSLYQHFYWIHILKQPGTCCRANFGKLAATSCWNTSSCAIIKVKQRQAWSLPRWVTAWCCMLRYVGDVINKSAELLIGELSSNFGHVRYIHLTTNTLKKDISQHLLPHLRVN